MGVNMAKPLNKLSPLTVKSMATKAKKKGKVEKATDGDGLYFVAEPIQSSWWRFDYRIGGKQKRIGAMPPAQRQMRRGTHP